MREWLSNLRLSSDMSKREASKALEISESYYNLIEKGYRQNEMNIFFADKIAKTFKVSITKVINAELKYRKGLKKWQTTKKL